MHACPNYRAFSLLTGIGKLYTGILISKVSLTAHVQFNNKQGGGGGPRRIMLIMLALRMIIDNKKQVKLFCVFIEPKKAYDTALREPLLFCLKWQKLAPKHTK